MNRLIALAATFSCIISYNSLSAQKYTLKETENDLNSPRHEFFSFNNNEFIDVGYQLDIDKASNIFVSCYDAGMKQQHSHQVAELAGKQYRYGFAFDNRLVIVTTDKDEKVAAQEINCKTGTLVGSPVELFELPGKRRSSMYKGSSPSNNYHCVVALGKKVSDYAETFSGVVFDKQRKVVSSFKHTVENRLKAFVDVNCVVSDNGEMTLVYSAYYQVSTNIPPVFKAVHVDKSGNAKVEEIAGLPKGELMGMDWQAKGNKIRFTGLKRLKWKEGYHTLVTGELNPAQHTATNVKETKLADKLIVPGYYKEKFNKEQLPYPGLLTTSFEYKDGSRTLVYEHKSDGAEISRSSSGSGAGTVTVSYFAKNTYVMKLNAANELQWVQVIGKDHYEERSDFHVGSACFMDEKENVHLIFYDNVKNTLCEPVKKPVYEPCSSDKTGLAVVQVAPNGNMTKQFITIKKESKYHFSPKHVVSFRKNELVFLSILEKGMSMMSNLSGIYNNSKWHLGIVRFL